MKIGQFSFSFFLFLSRFTLGVRSPLLFSDLLHDTLQNDNVSIGLLRPGLGARLQDLELLFEANQVLDRRDDGGGVGDELGAKARRGGVGYNGYIGRHGGPVAARGLGVQLGPEFRSGTGPHGVPRR